MERSPASLRFDSKDAARQHAWDRLQQERLARFPFPPHGRIPNFAGAREAARRLLELPVYRAARCLKVNPDAPQRHVRELALARGIAVLVPTPKLAGGFQLLDPRRIPPEARREAATRSTMEAWSTVLALDELPAIDAIVTGCAAVTPEGRRCGKGAGYSDLEWAILLELGHPPVPVATTVHEVQVLDAFPSAPNDLALHWIVTPTRTLEVREPPPAARGLDWSLLGEAELEAMPVLRELRSLRPASGGAPRSPP
jgi:5-formyltetrahydrofolate cyclo-ligase